MQTVTIDLPVHAAYMQKIEELTEWCKQNIGVGNTYFHEFVIQNESFNGIWYLDHAWQTIINNGHAKFTFRQDCDATMFSLRWQ